MPTGPDTIEAIIARAQADAAFDGVFVHYGLLAALPTKRERLYLLGVIDYARAPYSGGHRVRSESYDVRGLCEVHDLGHGGPEEASNRVWELLEALDASLVADPDLVTAQYTHELRIGGDEVVPMTDGWLARAVFSLGMQATR